MIEKKAKNFGYFEFTIFTIFMNRKYYKVSSYWSLQRDSSSLFVLHLSRKFLTQLTSPIILFRKMHKKFTFSSEWDIVPHRYIILCCIFNWIGYDCTQVNNFLLDFNLRLFPLNNDVFRLLINRIF